MQKSESLDIYKCLPSEIAINTAGTHLYQIGLSHFPFGPRTRNLFYHPYFVMAVIVFTITRFFAFLIIEFDDKNTFIMFGDFAYFIKVRDHYNLFIFLVLAFILTCQVMHYYD